MVNKVILVGNVGIDPEVRTLEGGAKVARIRLATTERLYDRASNETKEHTEWHTITLWRGLADVVDRYVRKGTQLYIEGRLRTREWMDKDNNKRYTTEILADTMNLLGRRSDNPASDAAPAYGAAGGYGQQPAGGSSAGYRPQGGYGTVRRWRHLEKPIPAIGFFSCPAACADALSVVARSGAVGTGVPQGLSRDSACRFRARICSRGREAVAKSAYCSYLRLSGAPAGFLLRNSGPGPAV